MQKHMFWETENEKEVGKRMYGNGNMHYSVTRLFFQRFAIYNNENLPESIQILPKCVDNFAKYQINLKILPEISKFLLKRQNFGKSGHTVCIDVCVWGSLRERPEEKKIANVEKERKKKRERKRGIVCASN